MLLGVTAGSAAFQETRPLGVGVVTEKAANVLQNAPKTPPTELPQWVNEGEIGGRGTKPYREVQAISTCSLRPNAASRR